MKVVRVVNNVAPAGSVAIGRGTIWGNPFIMGADGDREAVVSKFYQYALWRLEREPNWLEPLRGKDLACYCSPKMCHGHAIMALIEKMEERNKNMNGIRFCSDCKFDMDAEVPMDCGRENHVWHYADPYIQDMCCLCGLDAEMLLK